VEAHANVRIEKDRTLLIDLSQTQSINQATMNAHLASLAESDRREFEAGTLRHAPGFGSENYSDADYWAARRREKLLYFNLEFTNRCNLACRGCFAGFGDVSNVFEVQNPQPGYRHTKDVEGPLILEELQEIIDQGVKLGAKTVDLIGGGEPFMSKLFFPLAEHVVSRGLSVEVFTNGTLISPDYAKRMAELKILPFVKLYSSRSWVHDQMVGVEGAWRKAVTGIENLLKVGYGSNDGLLISLETIVVRRNRDDLPTLWRWARENGMIPYFERFVGCHYDGDPGELLTPAELKTVWEELWLLDRGEYGFSWPLLPLRVGYTCPTNFYSLYINYEGDVRPCSGLFEPLGNIRKLSLEQIMRSVPTVRDLRDFKRPQSSWCAGCYYFESERCPGCRGMAQIAGHYMADDPLCFHNPANLQQASEPRATPHLLERENKELAYAVRR
jgi:radical SAM protein with 4Fe4S-binding SPASM domain